MSESSLDSELLAVAGRKRAREGRQSPNDSESEEVSSDDVSLDSESWDGTKSSKKRGSKPPARKRQAKGRSAAASESEEEEADEESDEEDRLEIDEEELIEDEEDRKRLAAMTELQREFELATRAERRNQEMLRQKLLAKSDAKAERAGAQAAKRVGRAKSGREEREEAAKKSAMEELRAARERKARGAEERARKREGSEEAEDEEDEGGSGRRGRRHDSDSEEEGAISDEELSGDDRRRLFSRRGSDGEEDEEDEAPLEEVKLIQARRSKLEEWVNEPFFEDTLPGCMVRVVAGNYTDANGVTQPRYLLCQVVAVESRAPGYYKDSGQTWRNPYPFGPNNEKTSKWLVVERGSSQRGMPLALVSNHGFTEQEFESWQAALKGQSRTQLSRRAVKEVHERMVKANSYRYTDQDVARLLQEKRAKGQAPHNLALEKARLEAQLAYAREQGDEETAAEVEAQIAALGAALEEGKARRHKHSMADLNKRNADLNFKNALDNVSNRVGAAAGAQDAKSSQLDPFSRRATRPMIYWSTKRQQQAEEVGEAEAQAGGASPAAATQQEQQQQEEEQQDGEAGRGGRRRPDLDQIVDLSQLDLSILQQPPRMPPLARKLLGPTWRPWQPPPGSRIVSLEEYQRSGAMH